ncbi:MAG: phytase [Planctomycetes bacterium]|nr:phytase [Planctomycetota bacterium]
MKLTPDSPGPFALASFLFSAFLAAAPPGRAQTGSVSAVVETEPVPSNGDAADDSAIWVHPTVPSLSLVIGTDKDAGLAVYDLSGTELQFVPDGDLNNVDLRYGFPLGLAQVALVTSGERSNDVLAVYAVDPITRMLVNVAARPISLGFNVYGCCMYRSQDTGDYYFFGTAESGGVVQQWRLFGAASGGVDAELVRAFDVGGNSEGCVADDENGWFFVAEEDGSIWRYGAEPLDPTNNPFEVDSTGGGNLTADVEGLSIYYAPGGAGYLIASSQGNSTFVIYQRAAPHAHVLTFQVGANTPLGIDAVTGTDGIDVTNRGLGSAFPGGLFVAQDDSNPGGTQNFKLVSWPDIAELGEPDLIVNPNYGAPGPSEPPGGGGGGPSGGNLKGKIALQRDLLQPDPDAFGTIAMSVANGVQAFVVLAKKLDPPGGTYDVLLEEEAARGGFVDIGDLVPLNPNAGTWILALEASGAISELGGADVNRLAGRRVEIRDGASTHLFAVLPSLPNLLNVNLQGPLAAAPGSPAPNAVGLVKLRSKGKAGTSKFELKAKGLPVGPTYAVWVAEGATEGAALSQVGTLVKGKLKIDTKKGQTLPFEVGFLPDLYGRAIEVRDGTTTVLSGTIPSPAATDD